MPRVRQFQTNFTSGELDPFLFARTDTEQYFNGAARMRNVFVVPQGGFIRRDGLLFNNELPRQLVEDEPADLFSGATITAPNGGTVANLTDQDTATIFATTVNGAGVNPYEVFKIDFGSAQAIMFFDILGIFTNVAQLPSLVELQFSDDDSTYFNFGDTPVAAFAISAGVKPGAIPIVQPSATREATQRFTADIGTDPQPESHRFWRLVVNFTGFGGTQLISVREIQAFTYDTVGKVSQCRIIPFQFSITQRFTHVITDRNIRVFVDGQVVVDIPSPYIDKSLPTASPPISIVVSDIPFVNWAQDLDTLILTLAEEDPRRLRRFDQDVEWELDFVPLANIPQFTFVTAPEDVWSATRGWPVSVIFFQGRMWFAGSLSRPQTIWASKSLSVFDFDVGTGAADEAIDVTADTDEVNEFTQINAGRHLQFFATSGEFYVPNSDTEALTPTNIIIRRTTRRGISKTERDTTAFEKLLTIPRNKAKVATGLPRIQELDGAVLFPQRGGRSLREFLFTDTELAYRSENLTLLSSELVRNPVTIALRKSISTAEADFLIMPNFDDGTLAIFVTLRAQQVRAMTLHDTPGGGTTEGRFKDCAVDLDRIYFCIERTINGAKRTYFERFEAGLRMDAGNLVVLQNYGLKYSPNIVAFSEVGAPTAAVDVVAADFSVEYWLRMDNTTTKDNELIVGRGQGSGTLTHWRTGTKSGRPFFSIGDGTFGVAAEFTASISIDDGGPHHVVWTFDRVNDEVILYVDRNVQETIDISVVTGALDAGNIFVGPSSAFAAVTDDPDYLVDEIRLYLRVLGAAEIDQHFRSIFTDNTGLVWFIPADDLIATEDLNPLFIPFQRTANLAPGQTGINDLRLIGGSFVNVNYEAFAAPGHTDVISDLDQLEGETVAIRRAGLVQATQLVTNGEVTVTVGEAFGGDIIIEVGLDFTPRILVRTMPVDANLPEGTIIGQKKRVVSVTLKLKDTEHLNVGIPNFPTNQVPFRNLGSNLLDVPLTPFTGEKKVEGMLGYTDEGQIEITQSVPADMTVLGLAQRVSV